MWEARVSSRMFGRQRLQVCTIQDDQKIEWQDLDLPLLQKILHDLNGQELQIELLKERIGELKASSAALLMPVAVPAPKRRQRTEISPFGRRLQEAQIASLIKIADTPIVDQGAAVTALSRLEQQPCEPGCQHVGPNIGGPGEYKRLIYTCNPAPASAVEARIVAFDDATQDSEKPEWEDPLASCARRFAGSINPPFGGFPFTHAAM